MSSGQVITRLLPFGLLVFAVVCVPLRILSEDGLPRYRKLREQLTRVEQENQHLSRQIAQRTREVEGLRSDPAAVERLARDELNMIREGEIVFQFAPATNAAFLTSAPDLR